MSTLGGFFAFLEKRILLISFLLLSACGDSTLKDKFFDGSKLQDGLSTGTVYLWQRSPAENSDKINISSDENLDNKVDKSALVLTNIQNVNDSLRSDDVVIRYTDFNLTASKFFSWAGSYVSWLNDRPDFRSLFAYYHANRLVTYVDRLIASSYLPPDEPTGDYGLEDTIAWRSSVCNSGERAQDGRSCATVNQLLGGPVLPFHISVNNTKIPEGDDSFATDTGFCSLFNVDSMSNSLPYCLSRDRNTNWNELWHSKSLIRLISFYNDRDVKTFNFVDDADVLVHEFGHLLQAAVNPSLLETAPGENRHLDAMIEGMADYFAAAYLRSDRLFRYSTYNQYPLNPNSYSGELRGSERDVGNKLYFPDAYLLSDRSLGRVLSGAFNDIRKLGLSGDEGVARLPGGSCTKVTGCDLDDFTDRDDESERISNGTVSVSSDEAWDISLALLYRSFYALRALNSEEALAITMHRFSKIVVDQCASWTLCNQSFGSANVEKILVDRGLLSTRSFHPSVAIDSQSIETAAVEHLAHMGISRDDNTDENDVDFDNIYRRWGINLSQELAWIPYRPGGSNEFANEDDFPSPCEVVIVFPKIFNNSNSAHWGVAPGAPPAGWPAYAAAIASWDPGTFNGLTRGVDLVEIQYKASHSLPLGFENFEHPELGYIEPWRGLENAEWKKIPYLQAGENTQSLARNSKSRIYKTYQEKIFDKSILKKPIRSNSKLSSLRSSVGYIMRMPEDEGDEDEPTKAFMTFEINYQVANTTKLKTFDRVKKISGAEILGVRWFTQSLEVKPISSKDFCSD